MHADSRGRTHDCRIDVQEKPLVIAKRTLYVGALGAVVAVIFGVLGLWYGCTAAQAQPEQLCPQPAVSMSTEPVAVEGTGATSRPVVQAATDTEKSRRAPKNTRPVTPHRCAHRPVVQATSDTQKTTRAPENAGVVASSRTPQ